MGRKEITNLGMHFIPLIERYVPIADAGAEDGSVPPVFP